MREPQGGKVSATELLNKLFVRDCSGKLARSWLQLANGGELRWKKLVCGRVS